MAGFRFNTMASRWGRLYEGTKAEISLEDEVAALGVPYRTQFPGWKFGFRFFPDFFLPTLGLIIEVDDASHNKADKIAADNERTEILQGFGWRVVRCTNENALNDPRGTVRAMLRSVGLWPLPTRLPRLQQAMPPLQRAPQKIKREAKSAMRQARRGQPPPKSKARSPPKPAVSAKAPGHASHPKPQAPTATPTQEPPRPVVDWSAFED